MSRLKKVVTTVWEHKKKSAFGVFLAYLGGDWVYRYNQNQNIRTAYANLALKHGEQTISPDARPRRVTVLVNVEGNNRGCYDNFTKNALPLLNLAGLHVDVIKSDNVAQLEALAGALDHDEADAIYLVGGDGTIHTVVTGVLRNRDEAVLPIGIYPGGYDNTFLKRILSPMVYDCTKDVRCACESAMALIEDHRKSLAAFKISEVDSDQKPEYGVGDVSAGWFRQIEDKRKKMWYFGSARRRWAYFWEMLKRGPEDMVVNLEYEVACEGCEKCRPLVVIPPPAWRWWHALSGRPRFVEPEVKPKDFTGIVNEACGQVKSETKSGTELLIENQPLEEWSKLNVRVGGSNIGRTGVVSEGWDRCSADHVGSSLKDNFYSDNILTRSLKMTFISIPEYINRLYFGSNPTSEDATSKTWKIEATNKRIDVFLPQSLRVNVDAL